VNATATSRPARSGRTRDADVAVIGAGPYGLSVAAHLRGRGHAPLVFGEPMAGWIRHMPKGMFLKSERDASNLSAPAAGHTLVDYCRAAGITPPGPDEPLPIDLFVRYGLWFQEELVPDVQRERVQRVERAGSGFALELESGESLNAGRVVVAAGHVAYAYVPEELWALGAADSVSHACDHDDLATFAGKSVAVIGGGQSALESAALLREAGARTHVLVREDTVRWGTRRTTSWKLRAKPRGGLGPGWSLYVYDRAPWLVRRLPDAMRLHLVRTVLGPSGAWWLRDRVDGVVDIRPGCRVEEARAAGGAVELRCRNATGAVEELTVDHVLAATGYRVDLDRSGLVGGSLLPHIDRVGSAPRLSGRFESSVPGLFFTGLAAAPSFGPVLRFVCGTGFTARRVTMGLDA